MRGIVGTHFEVSFFPLDTVLLGRNIVNLAFIFIFLVGPRGCVCGGTVGFWVLFLTFLLGFVCALCMFQ